MLTNSRGGSPPRHATKTLKAIAVLIGIVSTHMIMKVGEIDVFFLTWAVEKAATLVLVLSVVLLLLLACHTLRASFKGDPECWQRIVQTCIRVLINGLNLFATAGDMIFGEDKKVLMDQVEGDRK